MTGADDADLNSIARRIGTAQDEAAQIDPITSEFGGFDLAQAYGVAHRIHEARLSEGAGTVGRKIGFTNYNLWPQYGVDEPIWGYVYDTTVEQALDRRVTYELGSFCEPKIEPEVVVHLAKTPAAGDLSEILGCVDWVAHGFEIVQSHYPGWRFAAADAVADSALHGALVVGESVSIDTLGPDPVRALESFSVTLFRDGKKLEVGKGSNVLGGPLTAVAHLFETLAKQPQYPPLEAGEIITTGTLTAAYPVRAGESYSAEFDGIPLPGLTIEIEG